MSSLFEDELVLFPLALTLALWVVVTWLPSRSLGEALFDHGVHTGTCLPILQIRGCVSNAWFPNNAWIPNMVAGLTSNVVTTFRISRARDLLFTNITIMVVMFLRILCHKGDFGLGFFPFLYQSLTGFHEHLGLFHWLEPQFCAFSGERGSRMLHSPLFP